MNSHYKMFFLLTFLTTSPLSLQAMEETNKEPNTSIPCKFNQNPEGSALAKNVLENGYFVHIVPLNLQEENFILRSGAVTPITTITDLLTHQTQYLPEVKAFRPCIYFSLNCAVADHSSAVHRKNTDFADRNFAVLIPASSHLNKVVNLHPADTAVWVKEIDLKQIPGCVVFARQGQYKNNQNWGKIDFRTFSPKESIHKTINNFISKKTGHLITLKDAPKGQEVHYDQALCGTTDLHNPTLFSFFIENKPYLSFGYEAGPKTSGIGPWLKFYHAFVDDFLRMWKQGLYAQSKGSALETEMMKKYRTEPYIVFAEAGLLEMERMLAGTGDIETDFYEVQKPKIAEALVNFKKYVQHNRLKEDFNNRLINFTLVHKSIYSPYSFFESFINNPAVVEDKEELHVLYWSLRYILKFGGAHFLEEKDELAELEKAGRALQKKTKEKGYTWSYARFLNTAALYLYTAPKTPEFNAYSHEALEKISYLLPKDGVVNCLFVDGKHSIKLKEMLAIPKSIWIKGTNVPALSSNRPKQDSF